MTDQTPSQEILNGTQEVLVEPLSITDKFIGVLSEPSATFTNLKQAGHKTSDWLVPLLILAIVIAIATYLKVSNPAMMDKIREQTQQQFEQRVAKGEMTREQADKASETLEKFGGLQAIFGAISMLIFVPLVLFFMALIYWLFLKFAFKGVVTYSLILAVYGLTAYFGVIDQLLTLIISYTTGNIYASVSLGLFMKPDLASPVFKLMNAINPITLWSMYVLGIGFSKVTELPKAKTLSVIFGVWLLWTLVSAFVHIPGFGG